jgi:hypothetical protein
MDAVIRPLTQYVSINTISQSSFSGNKLVIFSHSGLTDAYRTISCNKAGVNVSANSIGFSNTADVLKIDSANSLFAVNDYVFYQVPTSNTKIAGITTANAYYYVSFVNSSALALSATSGGANLDITDARTTATGEIHTIALNKYQIDLTGGQNIILEKDPTDTFRSDDTALIISGSAITYRN